MNVTVTAATNLITDTENLRPTLNIQQWDTANGAHVYFVAAPEIPIVDIAVVFRAGSARDENKPGIARLTNVMLEHGAKDLTADQIADQFDKVGAIYSKQTNQDMAIVRLRTLTASQFLNPALQVFNHVITSPTFPDSDLKGEKQQALNAIDQKKDSLSSLANDAFFQRLYGNQPYSHPVIGTHDSVISIKREDLQTFYKRFYVAKNAVVVLVGGIDKNQANSIALQITQGLAKGEEAPALSSAPITTTSQKVSSPLLIDHPSKQSHITLGQIGVTRNDPDYFSLYLGNYTLGGSSLVSRLGEEIRQKRGLGYMVESYLQPMEIAGPFQVEIESPNTTREQALQVAMDTTKKYVEQGPTLQELADARQNIIGGFPLRFSSNELILLNVINIAFYKLPLNYLDIFKAKMATVTRSQIQNAWQRKIHPDQFTTIIAGQK